MGYEVRARGVGPPGPEIGGFRGAVDAIGVRFVDWSADGFVRHWLFLLNTAVGIFAFLPFVAPYLLSIGQTGLARAIYLAYSLTCHQMPSRSYFVFGQQVAWCERDVAIWISIFLAGLAFSRHRRRQLGFRLYLLLITPMAIDGFTQLFGWRESNWMLRTVTGSLFGFASVFLTYPYLHRAVEEPEGR